MLRHADVDSTATSRGTSNSSSWIVKRRVLVGEDGTMWRMQAGRRHKRYKKGSKRLLALKGMVPLHKAHAAKLRKLGYKRSWWYTLKA
eukprot:gene5154-5394_t